jgi:Ca2+-transporting ATPase
MENSSPQRLWHRLEANETLTALDSSIEGLTPQEAEARLGAYGPNILAEQDGINYAAILLGQVANPLIFILLIAAGVTAAMGEVIDSGVIIAILVINGLIGFFQEIRAEQSVRALRRMVNPRVHVVRGGREMEIDGSLLVPGDVVLLVSGVLVPADLRLLQTVELRVDESMLTGESLPAEKNPERLEEENLPPGDQRNMAFMGTIVSGGRARGLVVRTGASTVLGGIAGDIRDIGTVRAPIQEKIARFGHLIGYVVMAASALLFMLGIGVGESLRDMFMTAVAAAVAAVPEGLPIVVTVALAVGVGRMARAKAIVRKLPAVETLGSATVICTDKTGTLTMNEMTVRKIFDGSRHWVAEGTGYDPAGALQFESGPDSDREDLLRLLRVGLLCNESSLIMEDDRYTIRGDPTEGALIVSALKAGLSLDGEQTAHPQLALLPFESERGYMATLHLQGNRKTLFVKGGLDRLMDLCPECSRAGSLRGTLTRIAGEFAREGLRVLAFAVKDMPPETLTVTEKDVTGGMTFLGLQGMIDPPRPEALEAVSGCLRSGIRVLMITGDHADTALAVARQLGIAREGDQALTGRELAVMADDELILRLNDTAVFARIAPEHKLRIVERLKARGEIVAVTGDGVNDAPALKAAHIGIAMGRTGTDVAKEAADMILADDNFASIYRAVGEGRVVFDNLRKAVFFLIPTGIAAIWSILVTVLLGIPMPYLPAQILWINLVTNGLQDVSLAFEPGDPDALNRPPRPPREPVMSSLLWQRTVLVSIVISVGVILVYLGARAAGAELDRARTLAMTTMVFFQFFQAWNSRSETRSVFSIPAFSNPLLFGSMVLATLAQIAAVYAPPLQWVFRTTPLSLPDWMLVLAVSASVIFVVEIDKALRRRYGIMKSS